MADLLDWNRAIATYNGGGIQPAMPAPAVESQPVATPEVASPATASPVLAPQAVAPAVMPTADVTNSRGAMAQMDQAAGVQAQAIQDRAAASVSGLQAQAELEGQQAQLEQQHLSQQSAAFERFQANREQMFKEYQDLNKQAEQAQVMDSRSSGQKAMGILAVALGGLGDAFSAMGGQRTNMAERIDSGIQAAVDRDLQLQMEAIRGKRAAAAAKFTELGMARSFFGDDQQAEEYARASRKEMYGKQLQAAAARAQIPQLQAAANEAAAKAISEAAEKKASLLASKENAAMSAQAQFARATAERPMSTSEQIALARLQRDLQADSRRPEVIAEEKGAKLTEDLVVRDPRIAVQHAKDADVFQKSVDSAKQTSQVIDEILALRKQYTLAERAKDAVGMSDVGAKLNSLATALTLNNKNINELGALSGPDMGLMKSLEGDPKRLFDTSEAQLKQVQRNLMKGTDDKAVTRGMEPVFHKPAAKNDAQGSVPLIRQEANASGTIRMQAPDGRMLNVPADKVEFLKSKGAKVL